MAKHQRNRERDAANRTDESPGTGAAEAVRAARDLAGAGQQARAIEACDRALQQGALPPQEQFALLDLRVEAQVAIGRFDAAQLDAQHLLRLSRALDDAAAVRANCALALVLTRRGDTRGAQGVARTAFDTARRLNDPWLEGLAGFRLAEALWRDKDLSAGLRAAQDAAACFEAAGDAMWAGRAWWSQSCALAGLGRTAERTHAAQRALDLALQTGDRAGLASALNMRWREHPDMAQRMRGLQQSLDAFGAAGYTERQLGIRHNLAIAYASLGLYRRARRMATEVVESEAQARASASLATTVGILAWIEIRLRDTKAAHRRLTQLARINRTLRDPSFSGFGHYFEARTALVRGDGSRARREAQAAVAAYRDRPETSFVIASLATLAEAWLALGKPARALQASAEAVERLRARDTQELAGSLTPVQIWAVHAFALEAAGRRSDALQPLQTAYRYLCATLAQLGDAGLRRSSFGRVEEHRQVLQSLRAHGQRKWPHLRRRASLREPFERLAESGLRLNELRGEAEVLDFLVDEATELVGAERVLLALDDAGSLRIVGSALPPDEDAPTLLAAITPWLDVARRTRAISLRYGPEGVADIDQRSCLVAPLIAGHELLGFLYADIEGLYGRFDDADRDLLGMLALQAAVALANARATEGLERTVAERTAALEQRAGELALINRIQQGIAGSLDFQSIVDLVGDHLREVFASANLGIHWIDEESGLLHSPYAFEHGKRLDLPPVPTATHLLGKRYHATLLARRAVLWRNQSDYDEWELFVAEGTDKSRSGVVAPILAGERLVGMVSLESHVADDVYGNADVRLLETVAAGLGVALENARLFDETQRLLKETEQRNAELAVINSIQQGIAGSLDFQSIVDLVGDKLREVFASGDLGISWWDEPSGRLVLAYVYEHGQRLNLPPFAVQAGSFVDRFIRGRRTVVLGNYAEQDAVDIKTHEGTDRCRSVVMVPMLSGERFLGSLQLEDHVRDHAFDAGQVRLLETVAAGMGVALQNARSYEAERQRREELAVINSIQHGMAQELDFQAIVDLVGDKLREMFATGNMGIEWLDRPAGLVHNLYIYEHGTRLHLPPTPYRPEHPLARELEEGRSVVLRNPDELAAWQVRIVPGTDSCLCSVWVPVTVGGDMRGVISLESFEREDAFGETEVHLLSTIAASMGVALENARLFEETQRRAREASALSEVGRDLSSTLELSSVMDAIARHARELLAASNSAIFLPEADGRTYRAIVALGDLAEKIKATVIEPGRGIIGTLLQTGQPELINRTVADPRAVQISGTDRGEDERLMAVPLLSDGQVQGAMAVWRMGGSPFEARELEFLVGLSLQAAVALRNARLFNETREALEQQRASAEVLQVISSSVSDTGPVFERILASCQHLFGGMHIGIAVVGEDGAIHLQSYAGPNRSAFEDIFPLPLSLESGAGAAILQRAVAHYGNVQSDPDVPLHVRRGCAITGIRSIVFAPMLWEGRGIGAVWVGRDHVQPFNEKEMSLLRTFADQAVIAIQNARLFNETQEALEHQRALSEILSAISNSPTDTQPVFEAIAASCERLFAGMYIGITLVDDDGAHLRLAAYRGPKREEYETIYPLPLGPTSGSGLAIAERRVIEFPDTEAAEVPAFVRRGTAMIGGRSILIAPLLAEGRGIGAIFVARAKRRSFTAREIALLKSFADQAVIAIENVRLFNETKEALEQQRTAADVLNVVSNSVADTRPVFEAIGNACQKLFASDQVVISLVREDGMVEHAAMALAPGQSDDDRDKAWQRLNHEFPRPLAKAYQAYPIRKRRVVHYPDMVDGPRVPESMRQMGRDIGNFSMLIAPMLWEGRGIGTIHLVRQPPRPFTEKEHALLASFADQAVIAIQNARLFHETQEALSHQTASADILRVISASPTDVQPVFDAIVATATRLLACDFAAVLRHDGKTYTPAAAVTPTGETPDLGPSVVPVDPAANFPSRVITSKAMLHLPDWGEIDLPPHEQHIREIAGIAATLMLPLMRGDDCIGVLALARRVAGPFNDREIALAKSFVDQAVIAIENVRLFNETREALERQTA
ncbi:MAG TPA: GAF domain-containing protein, partial [Burkholderiaceae bacterium]|nr:GAF domain-containing protein [Burkholderiaceae bacterium]